MNFSTALTESHSCKPHQSNRINLNSRIDASAANTLGQHLEVLAASNQNEIDAAFTTMVRQRAIRLL
jgi:hypothetical protein